VRFCAQVINHDHLSFVSSEQRDIAEEIKLALADSENIG
jgi:hypothetical protein